MATVSRTFPFGTRVGTAASLSSAPVSITKTNGRMVDLGYTHGYCPVMLDLRNTDRAAADAGPHRALANDHLRPLLDLVARILAEEFCARTAPAPERTATHVE